MSKKVVTIGNRPIGDDYPCYVIAEAGINHNGSIDIAKKLIDAAAGAGCDAIKFQKRTIEVVYTPEQLSKPRESPFGTTNGDLKRGLEFGKEEYQEINRYCKEKGIQWFASCWDQQSVDFIEQFEPVCYKIASASVTDFDLLRYTKEKGRSIIMSTGMCDIRIIDRAVEIVGKENLIILHCTSTYPSKASELNLKGIETLKARYDFPIGYSGHEAGLYTTYAAAVLGACVVERHITLDRSMWGSDHAASVEPNGIRRLVTDLRTWEEAKGDGEIKIYEDEMAVMEKLRRVDNSNDNLGLAEKGNS